MQNTSVAQLWSLMELSSRMEEIAWGMRPMELCLAGIPHNLYWLCLDLLSMYCIESGSLGTSVKSLDGTVNGRISAPLFPADNVMILWNHRNHTCRKGVQLIKKLVHIVCLFMVVSVIPTAQLTVRCIHITDTQEGLWIRFNLEQEVG